MQSDQNRQSGVQGSQQQNRRVVDVVRHGLRNNWFGSNFQSRIGDIASRNGLTVPQIQRFLDSSKAQTGGSAVSGSTSYSEDEIRIANVLWQEAQNQPDFARNFDQSRIARELNVPDSEIKHLYSQQHSGQQVGSTAGQTGSSGTGTTSAKK